MTTLIGFAYMLALAVIGAILGFSSPNPVLTVPLALVFFLMSFWLGKILNEGKHQHRASQTMALLDSTRPQVAAPFEHQHDPLLDLLNKPSPYGPQPVREDPYADPPRL